MAGRWRKEIGFPVTAAVVILADQFTKVWAKSALEDAAPPPEHYVARLTYVENTGAAFGLLTNQHFLIAFAVLMVIATVVIFYRFPMWNHPLLKIGLGMVLGGALGNLIDRLRLGYVVDFIDFRVWPVFNLADSSITIGIIMLAFYFIFLFKEKEKADE